MEQIRTELPEKAYLLFLYLLIVIISISITFLVAKPIEEMIIPPKLSAEVKVGGLTFGEIPNEQVRPRLQQLIQSAQTKPIQLTYGEHHWSIKPEEVGLNYDFETTYLALMEKSVNSKGIRRFWNEWISQEKFNPELDLIFKWNPDKANILLENLKKELDQQPQNAKLEAINGQVRFTNHAIGRNVSIEETSKNIERSFGMIQAERNVPVSVREQEPDVIGTDLEKIDVLLAEATTQLPSDIRLINENVKQVVKKLNGLLLKSNETFSFVKQVGPFINEASYKTFTDIHPLQEEGGIQFGIGQTASTLYWAAIKANVTIVERHPHVRPQTYISPGLDAAIWDGKIDLKLQNTFNYPVYIQARLIGNVVQISFYGNKKDKTNTEVVVEKIEKFPPKTIYLIDNKLGDGQSETMKRGEEGSLVHVYRIDRSATTLPVTTVFLDAKQESRKYVSKDYYRPISEVVLIGQINHKNQNEANKIGADSNLSAAENSNSDTSNGGFSNDPNMSSTQDRPSDIPDVSKDPNISSSN